MVHILKIILSGLNKNSEILFDKAEKFSSKLNIMEGVANGLVFLHSQHIVHRDIKPANILVVSTPAGITAKIADFGLCKILEPDQSTMSSNVGTLAFKAPELWNPKSHKRVRYNRTVDVYAAGLTFAAILQAVKGRSLKTKVRLRGDMEEFPFHRTKVGFMSSKLLWLKSFFFILD